MFIARCAFVIHKRAFTARIIYALEKDYLRVEKDYLLLWPSFFRIVSLFLITWRPFNQSMKLNEQKYINVVYITKFIFTILLVRQVKLRIQALISILIFTEILILIFKVLLHYIVSIARVKKTQPRLSPFRPDLSESKWGRCAAQRLRSLVYNEGFRLRKYPSKFSMCFNGLSSEISCH